MDTLNTVLSILFFIIGILILKYWTKDSVKESWGSIFGVYLGGIALILIGLLMLYMEVKNLM